MAISMVCSRGSRWSSAFSMTPSTSPPPISSVSSLLTQQGEFEVGGLVGDGLEAVQKASELLPDVVLMDARVPNMDGVEATKLKLR